MSDFDIAEDAYSKQAILNELENRDGEACTLLARFIRSLPIYDEDVLRAMVAKLKDTPTLFLAPDEWRRALSVLGLEMSKCTLTILRDLILNELGRVEPHIRYWNSHPPQPVAHFIARQIHAFRRDDHRPRSNRSSPHLAPSSSSSSSSSSPSSSSSNPFEPSPHYSPFSLPYARECRHKLQKLKHMQLSFALQAGRLHKFIYEMEQITSFERGIEPFVSYIESIDYEYATGRRSKIDGPSELMDRLVEILASFASLREFFDVSLQSCARPSHWQRNAVKYVVGGAATSLALYGLYQRRHAIAAYTAQTATSLRFFFREHVSEPIMAIYRSVFHTFRDRKVLIDTENLRQNQVALAGMLQDFGRKQADMLARMENKSTRQFLDELPKRAQDNDMALVMTKYEQDVNKPIRGLFFGTLAEGLLIQVQKLKLDTEAAMMTMDQVLTANEINFQLLATIPAVLVMAMGMTAAKNVVYALFFRTRPAIDLYQPLRHHLRMAEQLLIQSLSDVKEVDVNTRMGHLLLRLQKLERASAVMTPRDRKRFAGDVALLTSLELSVKQKLLLIEQMYRVYPFLRA